MRKGTQAFVSVVSLGLVAAGYQAGLSAEVSNGFSASAPAELASAAPVSNPTPTDSGTPTPAADGSSPAASTPAASTPAASTPAASTPVAAKPSGSTSTPQATVPAPVSTPKAPTTAPAPSGNASASTKTGAAIAYRFGTVQVSVTKAGGKITAVDLIQQGATGGRQAAFSYLVDLAVQANGSSFGNLSGATYTVDAFKQSLESALAKF